VFAGIFTPPCGWLFGVVSDSRVNVRGAAAMSSVDASTLARNATPVGTPALAGVRIVAVENFLAGNYGTMLMAMLGAEVIKVELPDTGDALRTNSPFHTRGGKRRSHGELRLMVGKRSVAVDIRRTLGRRAFEALIARSDVMWTNLRPGSLERLNITYDSLREVNSSIIYVTLSGFGHGDLMAAGPDTDAPAFDLIAQGLGGLQMRPAGAERHPVYNGVAIGDQVSSLYAVLGAVGALLQRERSKKGQRVDVAMFDCMLALNEKAVGMYTLFGTVTAPGESGTSAPYGAYRTQDGFVNIAVGGDAVWKRFCAAIGLPGLAEDARYEDAGSRVQRANEIDATVTRWTEKHKTQKLIELLRAANVPCARVHDVDSVVEDPQVALRDMLMTYDDPIAGTVSITGNPIKTDSAPVVLDPPPELGEDTWSVLTEMLGYTPEQVEELAADGTIRVEG
jgi:CoA:oxalate CoA-transferase